MVCLPGGPAKAFLTQWLCRLHEYYRPGLFFPARDKLLHSRGSVGGGKGTRGWCWRNPPDDLSSYRRVTGGHQPVLRATSKSLCRVSARDTCAASSLEDRAAAAPIAAGALRLTSPIVFKPVSSQICPLGNPALGFLPTGLYVLSETHSSLLGFRQKPADACFQAWGCLT